MNRLFISLVLFAGAQGLAASAQAQTLQGQIYAGVKGSAMCLGIKENDLSHPFMGPCANYAAQHWTVGPPNGHGFVRFQSARTGAGMCLGVAAADTSTVKMAPCGSVKNQQWLLTPTTQANIYHVSSQLLGPGVCLGIRPNSGDAELDLNTCHDSPGQFWTINP
jgi:hypothetical protein